MWGWVYGLVKAIAEVIGEKLSTAPPKRVATDDSQRGTVARFMQRVRSGRDSRSGSSRGPQSGESG